MLNILLCCLFDAFLAAMTMGFMISGGFPMKDFNRKEAAAILVAGSAVGLGSLAIL
ncbi:MAG: hypothetical protein JO370_12840 [Paucibacter sp.]|nr:hypothetical protein [Roseateles sp.]